MLFLLKLKLLSFIPSIRSLWKDLLALFGTSVSELHANLLAPFRSSGPSSVDILYKGTFP